MTLLIKNHALLLAVLINPNTFVTMSEGTPKQYSPEEIAKLEKSRTISDAELLQDGAEYRVDEKSEKVLEITNKQKNYLHRVVAEKNGRKDEMEKQQIEAATVFVKKMGPQIKKRIEKGDFSLIMEGIQSNSIHNILNSNQIDFLNELQREFKESDLDRLTDGISCRSCFISSLERGGDKELSEQVSFIGNKIESPDRWSDRVD